MIFQGLKFAFLSIKTKLSRLFNPQMEDQELKRLDLRPQIRPLREYLGISVWLARLEDPRLDPSLGGRDPTGRWVRGKTELVRVRFF
jgi:hypothetical protein